MTKSPQITIRECISRTRTCFASRQRIKAEQTVFQLKKETPLIWTITVFLCQRMSPVSVCCPLCYEVQIGYTLLSWRMNFYPLSVLDGWLRMGLVPPTREFCRHILSCRKLKAESFKRCLHSVLRGVSL